MSLRHTLLGDIQTSVKDFSLLEHLGLKNGISNRDVYYEKHIHNSSVVCCKLSIKPKLFFSPVSPVKEVLMQHIQIRID